jgi:hypothetical protein
VPCSSDVCKIIKKQKYRSECSSYSFTHSFITPVRQPPHEFDIFTP